MKHRSIWLAALLLGGTPLCAMALDYGPASPLLAAETGTQRLPVPAGDGAAVNDTARDDLAGAAADDEADSAAAPASSAARMTPSGTSPQPTAPAPSTGTARRTTPIQPTAHPEAPATMTSWQSLLPGSIQ